MNEIFCGAKVIYKNKVCKVKEMPSFCETGWWVTISDGFFEISTPIQNIIMPEGLNEAKNNSKKQE